MYQQLFITPFHRAAFYFGLTLNSLILNSNEKIFITYFFVCVFCKVYSQTSSRSAATVITNRTLVGFNAMNTIQPGQDWNSIVGAGTFIPKLIEMNPATLCYPGGTVANWFKISPGEFISESDPVLYDETNPLSLCYGFPEKYSAVTGLISDELNGFETAIDNTFAHPIIVVNVVTSDLASQLAMLEEARIAGLPVNFVELGNEAYHDECETVTKYQDGSDYAVKMLDWVSALRTRFTAVEIGGIGTTANASYDPPRRVAWNTEAASVWTTSGTANPEAFTMHHYAGINLPNTTGCQQINCSFDWPKMFLVPYTQYGNEIAQQITNINGTSLIPFDIWFTEYNMKNKTYYSHGSWGQFAIDQSVFTINNPVKGSTANPFDLVTNFPGYLWFNVNQLASNIPLEYGYDCYIPPIPRDDEFTELDYRIVHDSISAVDFESETQQTAAADLNYKLAANDSLRQSDTLYENYYNNKQSEANGQLSNVRMALRSMNSAEPEIKKQIAVNDTLVHYLMQSITVIDSSLYSSLSYNDSISKEAERSALLLNISGLVQANNQLLAQLQVSTNNIAATANGVNSNVIAVTDIETNEKLWNAIYFNKIVFRDFNYSTSQISTLHNIGNQCPFVGGRVVYKARTALRIIGDTTVYDDVGVCAALGISRKARANINNSTLGRLLVTPNPANNIATFYYNLNSEDIATIEIIDAVGIKNKQLSLTANSFETTCNFSNTSNGIYTCNLICNNKIISTCKLVIIK